MTAQEILEVIMNDDDHNAFGLRVDHAGIEIGTTLENSHEWFADYRDYWDELPDPDDLNSNPGHPYNEALGCWDDGELDGVSTVGIETNYSTPEPILRSIEKALKAIKAYECYDWKTSIYLVAGPWGQEGNDFNERIIADGTVIAVIA